MAAIVEERRNMALLLQSEECMNILFHIAYIEGLPTRPGWAPLAGTYVSVENLETKEGLQTEHKKITRGQTKWIENLPLLQVTDTSRVRFAIIHQGFLNKRSVLGTTDAFTIQDLLNMHRSAYRGIDKLVELLVTFDPVAIRGANSPKSPRLSRSSLNTVRTATSQSPRASLEVPTSPNRPESPSLFSLTTGSAFSPRCATLYLAVRETAVDPGMNIRVNASTWRIFVESCRNESLEELKSISDKVASLRNIFEQDDNCICLIDIILGAIEATWKLLSDPETMNVNRHITHAMMAINAALAPYQTFSQRRLAKREETSVLFLQEMLFSIVSTMWVVGAVFAAKGDALARDKLESRVILWTDYFQNCGQFLVGQVDQRPSLPINKNRTHCHKVLGPNSKIAKHNMISMTLPDVHTDDIYNRADVVRRLSEWVFSSTFEQPPFPTQERVSFAITPPLPLAPHSPNSPREMHRPPPLDLKRDDNFLPPHTIHGILTASERKRSAKRASTSELPLNNVFCLSGPAGSGKTQLAARMCEWLVQLHCLGGYFTFNGSADRITLDSLPMTLIHQIVTTEQASIGSFSKALAVESSALSSPLERRFETLFVEPLKDFVAGRANAKGNPLDPLVFIIDGVGVGKEEAEDKAIAQILVDWLCSRGFGKLPRFVKFFVFIKSETEVERLLRERGVHVLEMASISM